MTPVPDRATFLQQAQEGSLVPVYVDLLADFETPLSAYAKLRADGPACLLESIEGGTTLNRYSFLGCRPRKILLAYPDRVEWHDADGTLTETLPGADPLAVVREEIHRHPAVKLPNMPRFTGGAVGYLAYEYAHTVEPTVPIPEEHPLGTPLACFLVTDTVVIFDRANQTMRVLVNVPVLGDAEKAYDEACRKLEEITATLARPTTGLPQPVPAAVNLPTPASNMPRDRFEGIVSRCKEYIRAGDIIQVVPSQRFSLPFTGQPVDLYRTLRTVNPSPYMFLFEPGDFSLVGASPEVHVRLTDGRVEIRPIAGTRPRGKTIAEDLAYEKEMLADEKERAEHLMLVDLARNDIGRVCEYGSVNVPEYMIVERYSHVMHIASQVEGRLRPDEDAASLLRATFPAGTVTGAPKVRAMQIIAEMEQQQRGPYAGAVAYLSYDGNLDSCIAIRTATLKDDRVFIQAGAGIVADSVPASEYDETVNKARGLLRAVALADQLT